MQRKGRGKRRLTPPRASNAGHQLADRHSGHTTKPRVFSRVAFASTLGSRLQGGFSQTVASVHAMDMPSRASAPGSARQLQKAGAWAVC